MYDIRPVEESDLDAAWQLGALAFGYQDRERPPPKPPRGDDPWNRWGAFDSDGLLIAKAVDLHHEQWWGGRVVAASGIAGVAVQPEHRGTGAGRAVLTRALQAARARGASVANLFCTSTAVYRALGFEVGGALRTVDLPTAALERTTVPTVRVRAATGRDWPDVRAVYDEIARQGNGLLSRRGRLFPDPEGAALPEGIDGVTLACDDVGNVLGYASWQRGTGYGDTSVIAILDCLALRPDAARALLSVIASWGPVAATVRLRLLPWMDAVTTVLPLERAREHKTEVWMHRPLDVRAAVAAAGWRNAMDGDVAFRLVDPMIADNDGSWRLVVSGDEARLEPVTEAPDLALDVRGWSLLWCGAARAAQLRQAGFLTGLAAGLDGSLDRLLGGGLPAGALDYF